MSAERKLTSLNVSLPVSQKAYVQREATRSGCSTPSEYIRRLIHTDQSAKAQAALELKLLEGLSSGEARPLSESDWADLRKTVAERLKQRRKTRRSP